MASDQLHSGQSITLTALRTVLSLHTFAVLTQAVLAGQFLSGVESPVLFHEWTGWLVLALSLAQVVFAILLVLQGAPPWLLIASIFVLLAEVLQIGTGYGRFLGVHVPLGVFVFGVLTWLTIWSFRWQAEGGDRAV